SHKVEQLGRRLALGHKVSWQAVTGRLVRQQQLTTAVKRNYDLVLLSQTKKVLWSKFVAADDEVINFRNEFRDGIRPDSDGNDLFIDVHEIHAWNESVLAKR